MMNLKKEKLLKKTYDNYIELMLYDFPIDRIGEIVADDVTGYGTTVDEKILEIKRLLKIVTDQREQGIGIEMDFKMTPIHRRISPDKETGIYMDEFEISMVIDGAKNVIPLRLTSVFEFLEGKWKLVHIHGSKAVDTEGDTWHMDEWKKKNEALQTLVDEKTADLEEKNRELEIEATLERVRAVAMSMQKPDDLLDVCQVISEQLELLNVKNIRNVQVAIIEESKKNYANYQYFTAYSKPIYEETAYENNAAAKGMVMEMQKSINSYFIGSIKGKELAEFGEWRNKLDQFPDPLLDKSSAVFYYFYSIGKGGLGLTTYQDISNESLKIFKRFHKVFTLAYNRFIDIKQAEAQARETQIQLSLEKVRATAMAMHNSEDLSAIGKTIFSEFKSLGFESIRNTEIVINNDEKETITTYHYSDYGKEEFLEINYKGNPIVKKWAEDLNKAEDAFVPVSISKNELKSWDQYRQELGYKSDPDMAGAKGVHYYSYSTGLGALIISTWQTLTDDQINILERFRNVFKLSYQRFKDIEQAELQAREAQIQLGLERVRARAMAMHKSEQLAETAKVLFEQFNLLGKIPDRMSIGIVNEEKGNFELWVTDQKGETTDHAFLFRLDESVAAKIYKAWKKKKDAIVVDLTGQKLKDWIQYLKKEVKLPINAANIKSRRVQQAAFFSHGFLLLTSHQPVADEIMKLLVRFARVFDLTYTRFLDLKKAEAQAREAQIEASLEKVRGVALSLQKSDEMLQVAQVLYEQLLELGFVNIRNALIDIKNGNTDTFSDYDYSHEMSGTITQMSYHDDPTLEGQFKMMATTTNDFFELVLKGKELEDLKKMRIKNGEAPDPRLDNIDVLTYNLYSFGNGAIGISNFGVLSEEEKSVLARFNNVFTFAYKRYNDMVQAEHQAREVLVELSLERIRAQVTAMHESEELLDIVVTMQAEFNKLGHEAHYFWHMRWLPDKYEKALTNGDGTRIGNVLELPRGFHGLKKMMDWEKSDEPTAVFALEPDIAADYIDKMIKLGRFKEIDHSAPGPDEVRAMGGLTFVMARTTHGEIGYTLSGVIPNPPDEDITTLARFAGVFDLAYRRFEDLKHAERQHRETQIDLALERVRAKTMAMHNSHDMGITVVTLFEEVLKLGLDDDIRCGIGILEGKERMETRSATLGPNGEVDLKMGMLDMTVHPMLKRIKKAWKSGGTHYTDQMSGKDVIRYYTALNNEPDYPFYIDIDTLPKKEFHNSFSFTEGILFAFSPNPMSEETARVMGRFARVFGQTYRRFVDLQKAEAQAREAQIEAALERVRSKAMAMHSSEDLGLTVDTFFSELKSLNVSPHRCGVGIVNGETHMVRIQAIDTNQKDETKKIVGNLKLAGHPVLDKIFESWVNQVEYYPVLRGKEILEYYKVMNPQVKFHDFADDQVQYGYYFYFKEGGVYAWTDKELHDRDIEIFRKYTSVLSLTYRRYLDLKEAEAQAREARIEAALEKVRGQSMAMHKSEQLPETAKVLFEQFKSLGKIPDRIGIVLIREEVKEVELWATDQIGSQLKDKFRGSLDGASSMVKIHKAWKEGKESIVIDLTGQELNDWMRYTREEMKLAVNDANMKGRRVQQVAFFSQGFLIFTSNEPVADNIIKLLVRFAKVFDQAYIRFLDLQKAEEQAKEAVKQASLDRVRGQIASMRTTEDLKQLTPLVWRELNTLEVPFFRCGIFIVDDKKKHVNVYLTKPDGKPLGALDLDFKTNDLARAAVASWKKKEVYQTHWNREEFIAWTTEMMKLGQIKVPEKYQGSEEPPDSLHLHFIPFAQGMLYVGHRKQLEEEKIDLIKSLAEAFSFAYARYEDFVVLEEAKKRVEKALSELKATQSQLIHAEKMASLGELTAGIAHEIQNPLNFVNNFSEVNRELIAELKEEIENGDWEDAKAIAGDIEQNEEKIIHHGKRADAIVKGMLQHSRPGNDEKVPTDINALADEYLRLSYHGLRAKDKSFNADFKAELAPGLPEINIVPQEIGRVLLNLLNNAFYAVAEKAKNNPEGYKPLVKVVLEKVDKHAMISVIDNGNGIPDALKDKIFQPFFTTKPTGEGTGLGLSLSYDIITKGHGGTLAVESEDGKGTVFIIRLNV